jgi:hypothetical protein
VIFFIQRTTKEKRKKKIEKKNKKNNTPTFLKHCYLELVVERKLKQWRLTCPTISTKLIIRCHMSVSVRLQRERRESLAIIRFAIFIELAVM